MNEEETLQAESEVGFTSFEDSAEVPESETDGYASESVPETETTLAPETETTLAYEDTIQYDVNYGFGYMSLWFGIVFGCLLVLAFFKGFKK